MAGGCLAVWLRGVWGSYAWARGNARGRCAEVFWDKAARDSTAAWGASGLGWSAARTNVHNFTYGVKGLSGAEPEKRY